MSIMYKNIFSKITYKHTKMQVIAVDKTVDKNHFEEKKY